MANKLQELREKFIEEREKWKAEQEEEREKSKREKGEKVKKIKVPPKTDKQLKQSISEEELMRNMLSMILRDTYDEENKYVIKAKNSYNMEEKELDWDSTDREVRKNKLLTVMKKDIDAPYSRAPHIDNLLNLPPNLFIDYLDSYLKSSKTYTAFYEEWIDLNLDRILQVINEEDEKRNVELKVSNDANEIKARMVQLAREYAEGLNIDVPEEENSYTNILKMIAHTEYPDEDITKAIKKLHKTVSKEYIELARELGVSSPKGLSVANLCDYIAIQFRKLLSRVDPTLVDKLNKMPRDELVKEAEKNLGEGTEYVPSTILIVDILKRNMRPVLTVQTIGTLIAEARNLGIQEPETLDRAQLIGIISRTREELNKKIMHRVLYRGDIVLDEKKLNDQFKELYPKANKAEISAMVNGKIMTERIVDLEKEKLVEKIAKLTGSSLESLRNMSHDQLLSMIREKGDLWESLKRQAMIESLVNILNVDPSEFTDKGTDEIENALLLAESNLRDEVKSRNVINEYVRVQKCVDSIREFKWFPGDVTSAWIASPSQLHDISEYCGKEFIGPVKIFVDGKMQSLKLYKANFKFYTLLCNRYSYKCKQVGDVLTCHDIDNSPQYFIVGYTLKDKPRGFASKKVEVFYPPAPKLRMKKIQMSDDDGEERFYKTDIANVSSFTKKEYLVLQDETIFKIVKGHKKELEQLKLRSVDRLLNSVIDVDSERVAKDMLSSMLLKVAPRVSEYRADGDFVKQVVDIFVKRDINQLNKQLFYRIANIVVYLNIDQAKEFREKIAIKYYIPEVLVTLGVSEKLPGIYMEETSLESAELMASYIENAIDKLVRVMGEELLRTKDPTFRKLTRPAQDEAGLPKEFTVEPTLKYTCVNAEEQDTIPRDDLLLYKEAGKSYCLNLRKLLKKETVVDPVSGAVVTRDIFINPVTNKRLSQDFVDMHYFGYYDVDGQVYYFPFKDIYENFKNGNFINPLSPQKRKFRQEVITSVLSNINASRTYEEAILDRAEEHKEIAETVSRSVNPEDVKGVHMDLILVHKKAKDGAYYAFKIDEFVNSVKNGINPKTGEAYPEKFREKILSIYTPKEIVEEVKIEQPLANPNLIIPDLWNLVSNSINALENKAVVSFGMDREETESDKEDTESDKEETESDKEETESDKEDTESDKEETESDKEDTESDKEEEEDSDKEEEEDSDKEEKKCVHCGQPLGEKAVRSVGHDGTSSHSYDFCCPSCIEAYDFPKFKKQKKL